MTQPPRRTWYWAALALIAVLATACSSDTDAAQPAIDNPTSRPTAGQAVQAIDAAAFADCRLLLPSRFQATADGASVVVFLEIDAADSVVDAVLDAVGDVSEQSEFFDSERTLIEFTELFPDSPEISESIDPDELAPSIRIYDDLTSGDRSALEELDGVDRVVGPPAFVARACQNPAAQDAACATLTLDFGGSPLFAVIVDGWATARSTEPLQPVLDPAAFASASAALAQADLGAGLGLDIALVVENRDRADRAPTEPLSATFTENEIVAATEAAATIAEFTVANCTPG